MIEEILELGFDQIELGYDLRLDLVPGVRDMVNSGSVKIGSVHNYCPIPLGSTQGHPELFTFAHSDPRVREASIRHTTKTIEFAAEVGATVMVCHCGYVNCSLRTVKLFDMIMAGQKNTPAYDKLRSKMQIKRDKKSKPFLKYLYASIQKLLPILEEHNIILGIENLPSWEAVPTEYELEIMLREFNSPYLGYWHDIGHGQIRENLGFINQEKWLDRLEGNLVGMHIHDVKDLIQDHVMPPMGDVVFERFHKYIQNDIKRVLEPRPNSTAAEVKEALQLVKRTWNKQEMIDS